jgi:hypothetical protein
VIFFEKARQLWDRRAFLILEQSRGKKNLENAPTTIVSEHYPNQSTLGVTDTQEKTELSAARIVHGRVGEFNCPERGRTVTLVGAGALPSHSAVSAR